MSFENRKIDGSRVLRCKARAARRHFLSEPRPAFSFRRGVRVAKAGASSRTPQNRSEDQFRSVEVSRFAASQKEVKRAGEDAGAAKGNGQTESKEPAG